jgi:hypothetical protein
MPEGGQQPFSLGISLRNRPGIAPITGGQSLTSNPQDIGSIEVLSLVSHEVIGRVTLPDNPVCCLNRSGINE